MNIKASLLEIFLIATVYFTARKTLYFADPFTSSVAGFVLGILTAALAHKIRKHYSKEEDINNVIARSNFDYIKAKWKTKLGIASKKEQLKYEKTKQLLDANIFKRINKSKGSKHFMISEEELEEQKNKVKKFRERTATITRKYPELGTKDRKEFLEDFTTEISEMTSLARPKIRFMEDTGEAPNTPQDAILEFENGKRFKIPGEFDREKTALEITKIYKSLSDTSERPFLIEFTVEFGADKIESLGTENTLEGITFTSETEKDDLIRELEHQELRTVEDKTSKLENHQILESNRQNID